MWEPQPPRTLRTSTQIALEGLGTTGAEAPWEKKSPLTSFIVVIFITKTVNYFNQIAPTRVSIYSFLKPNLFTYL